MELSNFLEWFCPHTQTHTSYHPKLNKWLVMVALNSVFQKRDDARQFMRFLHPDLGVGTACLWKTFIFIFVLLLLIILKFLDYLVCIFMQSFQKNLMVLIVAYIFLKIPLAGLRMFMYGSSCTTWLLYFSLLLFTFFFFCLGIYL